MTHQGHSGTTLPCGLTQAKGNNCAKRPDIAITDPAENAHTGLPRPFKQARVTARTRIGRGVPRCHALRPASPRRATGHNRLGAELATLRERPDPWRVSEAALRTLKKAHNGALRRFGCARGCFGTRVMPISIPAHPHYPHEVPVAIPRLISWPAITCPTGLLSSTLPGYKVFVKP